MGFINKIYNQSLLDLNIDQKSDLVLIKTVLIHINPNHLELVYKNIYETLKKINPELRAIFVTGYTKDKKIADLVASSPYIDLLGKPYNISDIMSKILNLLAKK